MMLLHAFDTHRNCAAMASKTGFSVTIDTLCSLFATMLGGGLLLTWFSLCTSTASVLSLSDDSLGSFQMGILLFGFASVLGRLLALVVAARGERAIFASDRLLLLAVLGAAMSLPFVALSTLTANPVLSAFLWIGGLLLAAWCGAVVLLTFWIDTLSGFGRPFLLMLIVVGSFFLFMLFYFVLIALPPVAARAASPFLVVAAFLLLRFARRTSVEDVRIRVEHGPLSRNCRRYLGLLAVSSFFLGLIGQVVRSLTWAAGSFVYAVPSSVYHEVGIFLATLFVGTALVASAFGKRIASDQTLGLVCLFAMAFGIVVSGIVGQQLLPVADFALGVGLGCYQIQLCFYAATLEYRRESSPFVTFGLLYTPFELAGSVGLLAMVALRAASVAWSQIALVAIIALFLLTFAALIPFFDNQDNIFPSDSGDGDGGRCGDDGSPHRRYAGAFSQFGLTPREQEVAVLLLQGRNLPYIRETLSISEGTAKTHLLHIYRKCDVHDRQEFLSLFH